MESIRCGTCSRLLLRARPGAMVRGVEVKCPRCGTINHVELRAAESPSPERLRASNEESDAGGPEEASPSADPRRHR